MAGDAPGHDIAAFERAPRRRLGPGGAQLAGWLAVACVNQLLLVFASGGGELAVELLHHAYDLGQLAALGVTSFLVVRIVRWLIARARLGGSPFRWHALGLAVAVFSVSLIIVAPDVRNAATRYGVPSWLATFAAALVFGVTLGATGLFRLVRWRAARRGIAIALGSTLAVVNAFVLLGDYPAIHFMLAWAAASLFAIAAEGALPAPPVSRPVRRACLAALAAATFASVLLQPRQQVLARMYAVPSSVVAPYASKLFPKDYGYDLDRVRPEALTSPWFRDRKHAPPAPASGRIRVAKPRVVLIVVDTLRYDVVSKPEHLRRLPAFRSLHASGARFTRARAAATWTRASIGALMSGLSFSQLQWGMADRRPVLTEPIPRFAELLSQAGVSTTMIPFFSIIDARSGIGRGFRAEVPGRHDADVVIRKVIGLLEQSRGPSFIYAHIAEPHAPYQGTGSRFERYVQDVELVDTALLPLLEFLKKSKLAENTVVILTADHGEAFGEHGTYFHARNVYEELAHIPLIAFGPRIVPREITTPAALIDVGPTILDLFGLPAPGAYMGQSLVPLLAGENPTLDRPIAVHAGSMRGLYFPDGLKVIFALARGTTEVYDLDVDPGERHNLVESDRPDVRSAVETARMFFHVHRSPAAKEKGEADEPTDE